jgi:hypothetical protein
MERMSAVGVAPALGLGAAAAAAARLNAGPYTVYAQFIILASSSSKSAHVWFRSYHNELLFLMECQFVVSGCFRTGHLFLINCPYVVFREMYRVFIPGVYIPFSTPLPRRIGLLLRRQ